jgi:uncharacterized lipoprotein YddW (UPF0748 family)
MISKWVCAAVASLGLSAAVFGQAETKSAPPEVRGTWMTTTANTAISTPAKTAESMKRLRDIGLNVVYVECWKNGYTEYPSPTMEKLIGIPMKVNGAPANLQRDLLHETTVEAHRNGMLAIAWLEYGFMAAWKDTNNELRALGLKEGWLLEDKSGNVVGKKNSFVWMNPLHPKAQQIVIDITLDAIRLHDLDGVQLDDRIAMPTDMGYDKFTRELYAKEHNGAQPPDDNYDKAWVQWRADKITEFAKRYAAEVRKANPSLIVSVSPAPFPWSLENYACDWPKWLPWEGESRWDEFVPQNYRFNFERTKASIEEAFGFIGNRRKDLIAGIRIVGDGPDMPEKDLMQSIEFCREAGLGGHVHWFSRGVLEVFPEQLKAFYNVAQLGHAPHPARPADWRRLPIVAKETGDGAWTVTVDQPGKYRVIARRTAKGAEGTAAASQWETVESRVFEVGTAVLSVSDAEAVELLVDRRP